MWVCYLTLTTVGFDTAMGVPSNHSSMVVTFFYLIVGLGSLGSLFESCAEKALAVIRDLTFPLRQVEEAGFGCVDRYCGSLLRIDDSSAWAPVSEPVRFCFASEECGQLCIDFAAPLQLPGEPQVWPTVAHYRAFGNELFNDQLIPAGARKTF